jgi:CBS domain-containing protein
MKTKIVEDLMIPVEDYATVSYDATLREAVLALDEAHQRDSERHYRHRAVLVLKDGKVVGKLSMFDVIVALEPAYQALGNVRALEHSGLSLEFLHQVRESYSMWGSPISHTCERAASRPVRDVMYTPGEAEHVDKTASLDQAVHQLIVGSHQSLLVTDGGVVVGVLRLTDVFHEIMLAIKACKD